MDHLASWDLRLYGDEGSFVFRGTDVRANAIFVGQRPADILAEWGYEPPKHWGYPPQSRRLRALSLGTHVRDAARKPEALGLITILLRRGVFVATLDARDVKELFDVRIALESATIRLATPHIPKDEASRTRKLCIEAGEKLKAQSDEKHLSLPAVDLLIHKLALQYCDNSRLQKMMQEMWLN